MRARSFSVATSRSSRLRLRSVARSALRQTTSRSPGKSGEVIEAMSRWSNSVSCKAPLFNRSLIAGPRSAVIQSRPADLMSSVMRAGDHAAVADQHHVAEAEALLELVDLRRQRRRIAGVAVEHFDRNLTTVRCAEQAVDDLQGAFLAVTAVSPFGQRTTAPLHGARRDVVEHQRAVLKVTLGQRGLDGGLACQQPVECCVEFVVIHLAKIERFAQAGGCRGRREYPGGGELGDGVKDAPDQQGEDEVAAAIAVRAEDAVKADLARRAEGGGDVAMG